MWLSEGMSIGRRRQIWRGLALAGALTATLAAAQDDVDVEGLVNDGIAWAQANLPPDLLQQLALP